MTTLRWVPPFHLEAPELDGAHHRLLAHTQAAILALQRAETKRATQAIATLDDESRRHFDSENRLMRRIAYPGYINHQEQHRRLLRQLDQLQLALALTKPDFGRAIHLLRGWFTLHLIRDDAKLSTFLGR